MCANGKCVYISHESCNHCFHVVYLFFLCTFAICTKLNLANTAKPKTKYSRPATKATANAKAKASGPAEVVSGEAQASGHAEGMGAESSASVRLAYQPNCMRCDEMGSGVRLDLRGQVIEREPVCAACGALAEAAPPLEAEKGASPAAAQPQAAEDDKAWARQAVLDAYEGRHDDMMSMTLEEIKVLHEQGKMTDEQFELNKERIKLRDELNHGKDKAPEAGTQREQSTGNGGGAEDADKTGTEDVKVVNSEIELHTAKYGLDVAPPPPSQHLCRHCRRPLDMSAKGDRIVRKQPPTYKCAVCNSRHVTLNRQFGTWPLEEFTYLSDEEQSIFYKSVAERGADHKTVEDLLVEVLSKRRLAISRSSEIGKFLPLGVWQTQGWNTDEIVKHARPEDIETNKLGMLTYRVVVKETEKSKIEEDVRTALRKIVQQNGGCKKGGRHELTLGRREESAEAEVDERPRSRSKSRSRSRSRCSSKRGQHSSSRSVSKHSKRKRSRSKSGRSRRTRSKRSKSKSHRQRRRSSKSQQSRRKRSRSKSRRSRHTRSKSKRHNKRSRSEIDQRRRRSKSDKKRGRSNSCKKVERQPTPKRSRSRKRSPVDPKQSVRERREQERKEKEAAREALKRELEAAREREKKER